MYPIKSEYFGKEVFLGSNIKRKNPLQVDLCFNFGKPFCTLACQLLHHWHRQSSHSHMFFPAVFILEFSSRRHTLLRSPSNMTRFFFPRRSEPEKKISTKITTLGCDILPPKKKTLNITFLNKNDGFGRLSSRLPFLLKIKWDLHFHGHILPFVFETFSGTSSAPSSGNTKVSEILNSVREAMGKYGFDILNASRHVKKTTRVVRGAVFCFQLIFVCF